ncbi:hypothetical protein ACHHRT_05540 [Desulfurivibrio sp. D14AmB]|uniref:hypothetical protein n=1 Tax=Desulfurivibrio sp. D14AmB TaxID=3374370 RepID=UPI00376EE12F
MPSRPLGLVGLLLLVAALLVACAQGPGRQSEQLLAREYRGQSEAELQSYYRQLSDQLVRETRALRQAGPLARPAAEKRLELLRGRWNEVRAELRRLEAPP